MWELDHKESWAPKNWCFWTPPVLEKTLESPLDCKEIQPVHPKDQSWVFTGRTDVKLKLQYFGHLMQKADSFEKTLMLGKIEGRRKGRQRMRWSDGITQWTWVWVNSGSWWWTGKPDMLWFMGLQRVRHDWVTELNWTELKIVVAEYICRRGEKKKLKTALSFWPGHPHIVKKCSSWKKKQFWKMKQ